MNAGGSPPAHTGRVWVSRAYPPFGVGHAAAGDVGRGAVHRLEHRRFTPIGSRSPYGATPMDPHTAAAASLGCRRTGSSAPRRRGPAGRLMRRAASAFTCIGRHPASGCSADTSAMTSSQNGMVCMILLDLVPKTSRPPQLREAARERALVLMRCHEDSLVMRLLGTPTSRGCPPHHDEDWPGGPRIRRSARACPVPPPSGTTLKQGRDQVCTFWMNPNSLIDPSEANWWRVRYTCEQYASFAACDK
jgi:hypothetical protein